MTEVFCHRRNNYLRTEHWHICTSMDENKREELQLATRDAAIALLEDLEDLRLLLGQVGPRRSHVRKASNELRKLIGADGALQKIASPRRGRVQLVAPDNSLLYRPLASFPKVIVSGGASIYGIFVRAGIGREGMVDMPEFDPEKSVAMSIHNFKKQPVLFCFGRWINREAIVNYVANKADGVHAAQGALDANNQFIKSARSTVTISRGPPTTISVPPPYEETVNWQEPGLVPDPNSIDAVLFELLCTAYFIVSSPDVIKLEKFIRDELG